MDVKKVLESIEQETRTDCKQDAKADFGKPRPSLVPPHAVLAIAEVREYGTAKYGSPDNWRFVEPERYVDALYRHLLAVVEKGPVSYTHLDVYKRQAYRRLQFPGYHCP